MTEQMHRSRPSSLRAASALHHRVFGAAVSTFDLASEPYRAAIVRECSLVAAEYEMKWDAIAGQGGEPDYRAADALAAFAETHGLALHGHTLWWHEAIPEHLLDGDPASFADAAVAHLDATTRRYAGRVRSWDVVNEPLDLAQGCGDGLRRSRFLEGIGPGYIGVAFRRVAALDPGATLILNEMGLEYDSPESEDKRRAMLALLERELAAGTPIGCLGIQSHLEAGPQPGRHPDLRAFLREVDALGLAVAVTEMDVSDWRCPRDIRTRDAMVADTYRSYLDLVLESCRVQAVTTWGLSDARTWLAAFRPRADGSPVRPLPLDRAFRRKPAWHAIRAALSAPQPAATSPKAT